MLFFVPWDPHWVNVAKVHSGLVIGIASVDWVLEILANSLCATGQMIGRKVLTAKGASSLRDGAFRISRQDVAPTVATAFLNPPQCENCDRDLLLLRWVLKI